VNFLEQFTGAERFFRQFSFQTLLAREVFCGLAGTFGKFTPPILFCIPPVLTQHKEVITAKDRTERKRKTVKPQKRVSPQKSKKGTSQ
jgi:hypothetical protein